jgi:hypothetical protein
VVIAAVFRIPVYVHAHCRAILVIDKICHLNITMSNTESYLTSWRLLSASRSRSYLGKLVTMLRPAQFSPMNCCGSRNATRILPQQPNDPTWPQQPLNAISVHTQVFGLHREPEMHDVEVGQSRPLPAVIATTGQPCARTLRPLTAYLEERRQWSTHDSQDQLNLRSSSPTITNSAPIQRHLCWLSRTQELSSHKKFAA